MSTNDAVDRVYNFMDEIWRLSMGEHADITNALYDGDYSKSLEQAQRDKHEYIMDAIRVRPGARILDVGCGWGGLLLAVRARGATGVGLTISRKQAEACWRAGLDVDLRDWRDLDPKTLSKFDGIASVGAFEHFCSEQEFVLGEQQALYDAFFRRCCDLLVDGGRLFLQTMTWGPKVPHPDDIRLDAPSGSDEHVLALLREFYGGSGWLPTGIEQLEQAARPGFELIDLKNGRLDYIETIAQWGHRIGRPTLAKVRLVTVFALRCLADTRLRNRLRSYFAGSNQECFRRHIMDHFRLVFEKRADVSGAPRRR